MKIQLTFGVCIILLTACNENKQNNLSQTDDKTAASGDTIVGTKIITNEIAGSAHRNRAMGYYLTVDKDTSDFICIFFESKDGGKVGIDLNIPYSKRSMTYRQRLSEFQTILPIASKDFNFDSLTSISFGRLILSGDLAIDVTKQYIEKFGTSSKIGSNRIVANFLNESKLATDIDSIFKPYSISVDNISIEKLFFTPKSDLYWASKIETDTTNVPEKIIDCMLWAGMSRK